MIGTKIILEDQSYIPSLNIAESIVRPIVFTAFTSDKGTEDYIKIEGSKFFDQYGQISFARHGQPLLQAANVINNGGIVYAKRVVDPTAKLANFCVIANIKDAERQEMRNKIDPVTHQVMVDEEGVIIQEPMFWKASDVASIMNSRNRPLYTETEAKAEDGTPGVPAKYKVALVNYELVTFQPADNTFGNDDKAMAQAFYQRYKNDGSNRRYPLFMICDNGRGVSRKNITISMDSTLSRSAQACRYVIDIDEDGDTLESIVFSLNPDEVENGYNLFFDSAVKRVSSQIRCHGFEDQVNLFFKDLAYFTGISENELRTCDIIGAKNYKGATYKYFEINYENENRQATTVKLDAIGGHSLLNGTNGDNFGDSPIKTYGGVNDSTSTYALEMTKAFDGTFLDDIYDVDNNPIDVVVDANYPHITKRAIEALCAFRQDVFFFRDMGTQGMTNILSIKNAYTLNTTGNTRYTGTYCQYYDIYDPYTRKQITVTIGYSIARLICMHFANGRSLVCAGKSNGWVIPEIIEGTLNFVPKITPAGDQVNEMDDLRINFGKYYNGEFCLASEYTSQEIYTQLSWINNVLSVQELIKDIRVACPKSRYKFITGSDFEDYKTDVKAVIDKHTNKFKSIEIDYQSDSVYAANKIVYAVIKVSFKDFAQAEIFRIIAIPIDTTVSSGRI